MPRIPGQNLAVRHAACADDLDAPAGRVMAERIAGALRGDGFPDAVAKCYTDRGWSVEASAGEAKVSIDLMLEQEPDRWLLQLSVINQPTLLSRVLSATAKGHATEMGRFAGAVHRALESLGCSEFRWCLDDYPGTGWTSSTPFRPPENAR